jgi:hypothetical protein
MRAAAAVQTSGHFSDGISLHLLRAALGTLSPFAALQRFGLLYEGLLPCRGVARQGSS